MRISEKQDQIAAAIHAGKKTIVLIGAIGTSKTYGASIAMHTIANDYPGSRMFIGKRHMPELRKTTMFLFRESAYDMGLRENYHYTEYRSQGNEHLEYNPPGFAKPSYAFYIEVDHTRGLNRLKLDSTCIFLDEADDIDFEAYTTLASRVGRVNKNGAPAFVMLACNPNEGWIKDKFYNKFKDPEQYGPLPDDVAVIEFEMQDSFLGAEYYNQFEANPEQWKQRFLYNNWSYGDDMYSLFKYRDMDSVHVNTFERGPRNIAVDAARTHDRTVAAMWDNNVLVDIQVVKDLGVEIDYDEQAGILHDYAVASGVGPECIDVDAVGEGQGLITAFKTLYGWQVNSFVSNAVPESKRALERKLAQASTQDERLRIRQNSPIVYKDLRSEQAYLLSLDLGTANVHFWDGCPYLKEFKKEATMHNHSEKGRVMILEPKDKVKERARQSPDIFDSVLMGYYRQRKLRQVGTYGQRKTPEATGNRRGSTLTGGLLGKRF